MTANNPTLPEVPKPDMGAKARFQEVGPDWHNACIDEAAPMPDPLGIFDYKVAGMNVIVDNREPISTFGRKPRTLRHDTLDNRGKA